MSVMVNFLNFLHTQQLANHFMVLALGCLDLQKEVFEPFFFEAFLFCLLKLFAQDREKRKSNKNDGLYHK